MNIFELHAFPSQTEREEIKKKYFDTASLTIDDKKYTENNNLADHYRLDISESAFSAINKDFREEVRRFNNQVFSLTVTLYQFVHYYNLLHTSGIAEYEIWFREEARRLCNDIYVYQEKMRSLLLSLFKIDDSQDIKRKEFLKELKNKSFGDTSKLSLISAIKKYFTLESVKLVNGIRIAEVHNRSVLDEYNDEILIEPGITIETTPFHVISNEQLYKGIMDCLHAISDLKSRFQNVIDTYIINDLVPLNEVGMSCETLYMEYKIKRNANYFLLPNYTFSKACNNAYADMARHVLHITEKKDKDKRKLRDIVECLFKKQLLNIKFDSQSTFDEWHTETCEKLIDIYRDNKCIDKNGQPSFTYGHAQKWLNMLFKYLYVYEYSDEFKDFFKDKTELIKYLHVPIDDTILEEACKDFKLEKPDRGWSQMNKNTYMAFQQKLKDKIMTSSNPPYGEEDGKIPFYWKLMVWSKVEIS